MKHSTRVRWNSPWVPATYALVAGNLLASLAWAAGPSSLVSATVSGLTSGNSDSITTDRQRPSRRLVSFDGRYVVFVSQATNLTGTPDANALFDVFRRDLSTGNTELVSLNQTGNGA